MVEEKFVIPPPYSPSVAITNLLGGKTGSLEESSLEHLRQMVRGRSPFLCLTANRGAHAHARSHECVRVSAIASSPAGAAPQSQHKGGQPLTQPDMCTYAYTPACAMV
ncbi:hypothetical protein EON67_10910 [archaeon]|nr:MAG: hypothetical protein EON67_10910 [archaeon]